MNNFDKIKKVENVEQLAVIEKELLIEFLELALKGIYQETIYEKSVILDLIEFKKNEEYQKQILEYIKSWLELQCKDGAE